LRWSDGIIANVGSGGFVHEAVEAVGSREAGEAVHDGIDVLASAVFVDEVVAGGALGTLHGGESVQPHFGELKNFNEPIVSDDIVLDGCDQG